MLCTAQTAFGFERTDKEQKKLTIYGLPSGIGKDGVKFIVSQIVGDPNPDVYKLPSNMRADVVNGAPLSIPLEISPITRKWHLWCSRTIK